MDDPASEAMQVLAPEELGPTISVGEILVEVMATTIGDGFRTPQPLHGPFPSGAPAIFIDQCARLGGDAAMIGAVGADDFGSLAVGRLAADGVDVSAVVTVPDRPTGSAFVRYRKDGNRDFVFNIAHSAAAHFGWSEPVQTLAHRAGHLHVTGSCLTMAVARDVILRTLPIIKDRGGSVSFDPNLRKELSQDAEVKRSFDLVLAQTDLLLPSGDELLFAAATANSDQAITALLQLGVREIVLKQGELGATAYTVDGDSIHKPSFDADLVDPTGAGDCFGGAYVTLRRQGRSIAQALEAANAVGARQVTVRGPMEGASTSEDLAAFLASAPKHMSASQQKVTP